ncbi:MAG: hypothetical protein M1834_002295 [Cirrosporium novae-zelandiae]|nr:MAG: hypothetical protein M1834_002295 [Cirrosporium novae-zelandiae]
MPGLSFPAARRPHLLTLPPEIRLLILEYLLLPGPTRTLSIRSEKPKVYRLMKHSKYRSRSSYWVLCERMRAQCLETTYHLVNNPGIDTAILPINRKLYHEACHVLYSRYTFDFHTDIEAVIPFMADLSLVSRNSIQSIDLWKRPLPRVKEFDRAEWRNTCEYLRAQMHLDRLGLHIIGGRPLPTFRTGQKFNAETFKALEYIEGQDNMAWVQDLRSIKGLRKLDVVAQIQHCPPPRALLSTCVRK